MLIKINKGDVSVKTRWYRRVGSKNVKFNISKSGVSTSIKLGRLTINPQRNKIKT